MTLTPALVSSALVLFACVTLDSTRISAAEKTANPANPARFMGFHKFDKWTRTAGESGSAVLTSPQIDAGIPWDELIASWNASTPPGTGLKVEARGIYPDYETRFYTLGLWSSDPGVTAFDKEAAPTLHPRESVNGQKDEDGNVDTDTLVLKRPGAKAEIRITLDGSGDRAPELRFLGLSFLDSRSPRLTGDTPKKRRAWGRVLEVPERAQGSYPHGGVICSPTCTSMTLSFWSIVAARPELDKDVPEVVQGVYDRAWGGTGNWPFNTAYAGSFSGMRAYVTRFTSVAEMEQWIEAGIPVVCSVSYDLLRGRPLSANEAGHLVICVGFTKVGDVILNDPALNPKRGLRVRTPYPRKQFETGWAHSRNTVYLIYPDSHRIPANRLKHWDG
jgi:hypothetical protein